MDLKKILTAPEDILLQKSKYQGIMFLGGFLVFIWGFIFNSKLSLQIPGYIPLALLCWTGSYIIGFRKINPYTELVYTIVSTVAIAHHFYLIELNDQSTVFQLSLILAMVMAALPLHNFILFTYFTTLPMIYALASFTVHQNSNSGVRFLAVFSVGLVMVYSTWERSKLEKKLKEQKDSLDIEKHKSALASKMAALGEMAGGIAHEINNPLTILKGQIALVGLYSQSNQTENQQQLARIISTSNKTIDRIAKIVQSLRHISQKSTNEEIKQIELLSLLEEVLALCESKVTNRKIEIQYHAEQWKVLVEIREIQFSQVLINLVNNAIDAVENSQTKLIQLDLQKFPRHFILRVSDSGHGIPLEIRDKIMEPFFTTKEIGKGTGLGLSTSKGLTESNGGKIFLDEKASQTTFVVEWPTKR